MRTKLYFLLLLCFVSVSSIAQTKLIAHKSHSGNMDNFKLALKADNFGLKHAGFGLPSLDDHLKSITLLPKKRVAIYMIYYHRGTKKIWEKRRDTITLKELKVKQINENEVKSAVAKRYRTINPLKTIEFFDLRKATQAPKIKHKNDSKMKIKTPKPTPPPAKKKSSNKQEKSQEAHKNKTPVLTPDADDQVPPYDPLLWLLVSAMAGITALVGGIAWRLRKLTSLQTT